MKRKKKDVKSAIKRPIDSPSQNTTTTMENVKQKKMAILSENDCNPGSKQTITCKTDLNTNKADETNTNRSKGKHKVDIFDEIFNQKKCVSSKDEDFIKKSHDEEERDDHIVSSTVSRPPFVRSPDNDCRQSNIRTEFKRPNQQCCQYNSE